MKSSDSFILENNRQAMFRPAGSAFTSEQMQQLVEAARLQQGEDKVEEFRFRIARILAEYRRGCALYPGGSPSPLETVQRSMPGVSRLYSAAPFRKMKDHPRKLSSIIAFEIRQMQGWSAEDLQDGRMSRLHSSTWIFLEELIAGRYGRKGPSIAKWLGASCHCQAFLLGIASSVQVKGKSGPDAAPKQLAVNRLCDLLNRLGTSRPGRSYDNTHTREQGFFLNFVQLFFRLADGKDKAGSAASQIRHTAAGLVRKAINRLNVVDPRG